MSHRIPALDILEVPEKGPVAELAQRIARMLVTALAGVPADQYETAISHVLDAVMDELQAHGSTLEEVEEFATLVSAVVGLIELDMTGGAPMAAPSFC
jgi:hypothetical protein